MSTIRVELTSPFAKVPVKSSLDAAGYDLFSIDNVMLPPGARQLISTGIKVACPKNAYLRIAPRSGLAFKHGIDVLAGVVDPDYRGNVNVVMINLGSELFEVRQGDRIAQIIPTLLLPDSSMERVHTLDTTERGGGGFGSTGRS